VLLLVLLLVVLLVVLLVLLLQGHTCVGVTMMSTGTSHSIILSGSINSSSNWQS
jgi:preprotein translocase subunit SecG